MKADRAGVVIRSVAGVLLALIGWTGPGTVHPAMAQSHDLPPVAEAVRASGPIVIDGTLGDPAWAEAVPVTHFRQREPDEGAPVSQPTEVRILYDDDALYIGARLTDTLGVTTRLGRRDMALMDSDWFGVSLDSSEDRRTAFRFQANPGGVQRDAIVTTGGGGESVDLSWDPVWEVATTVDDDGWTVEMRIPFSQLRFRSGDTPEWGLQIERIIGRRSEEAHFAFVPRSEPGGVPSYGRLAGLGAIDPGQRLELLPYMAVRGEYVDPGANPFRSDREHGADMGVDLLYRLSGDLTFNATVNPDFGQVEVDPAVVNLGVYETFFPERRPFFVEGSDIFDFTGNTSGGRLFHRRRIGRPPEIGAPTAQADVPSSTPILAAGKLTGRVGDGLALGVLSALTGRVEGRYLSEEGTVERMTVAPLTNHLAIRTRRNLRGGASSYGIAASSVVRRTDTPEVEAQLHGSAWTGGIDFRHEWSDRRWRLTGSVAGSHVRGSEEAIARTQRASHHFFQRPDADHLDYDPTRTTLGGYSTGITLTRQAGERWRGSLAGALTSPGYEVNDLGFATRTDRRDLQGTLTRQETRPGEHIRDWSVTADVRHEENFAGERVQRRYALRGGFRHLDYWSAGFALQHGARALDDRSTRGGPLMIRPSESVAALEVGSDPRRSVAGFVSTAVLRDEEGASGWEVGGRVQLRPSPRWNLSVGPYVSSGRIAAQYIGTVPDAGAEETFGAHYLFAPLDFTQLRTDLRLDATLAPRLTLELFAQPLIFAFDYDEVGALARPGTFEFEPWEGNLPALDRTLRSLVGNAVLRWEWRPGSTLYLAWQQRRQGFGDEGRFSFRDDVSGIFGTGSDNILVAKMTYWINP